MAGSSSMIRIVAGMGAPGIGGLRKSAHDTGPLLQ
jgi:hypothetical protein